LPAFLGVVDGNLNDRMRLLDFFSGLLGIAQVGIGGLGLPVDLYSTACPTATRPA
jgi:hypothetical protein